MVVVSVGSGMGWIVLALDMAVGVGVFSACVCSCCAVAVRVRAVARSVIDCTNHRMFISLLHVSNRCMSISGSGWSMFIAPHVYGVVEREKAALVPLVVGGSGRRAGKVRHRSGKL